MGSSDDEWHDAVSGEDVFNSTPLLSDGSLSEPGVSPINLGHRFRAGLYRRRRVVYSSEEDLTLPPEPTRTCLGNWKPSLVQVDKYVDDNLQEDRVSFENARKIYVDGKKNTEQNMQLLRKMCSGTS